jgi:hypothetical protein
MPNGDFDLAALRPARGAEKRPNRSPQGFIQPNRLYPTSGCPAPRRRALIYAP